MFGTHSKKCGLNHAQLFVLQLAAVMLLLPASARAQASWFIDAGRFHVSVHGQTSCLDCHGALLKKAPHPNPADVDKSPADFFNVDQCMSCHEETLAKIDDGTHGGKQIEDPRRYRLCIDCHDPHYQLGKTNLPPAFDPEKPVSAQCAACHANRTELPALSARDTACMACHRSFRSDDSGGAARISAFCFQCHDDRKAGGADASTPCMKLSVHSYDSSTHRNLPCTTCHLDSAQFGHSKQKQAQCLKCHARHDEKTAHDAHLNVSCEACHLTGVTAIKSSKSGEILHEIDRKSPESANLHQMTLKGDESSCRRCHFSGNALGASTMVLPPKSLLCMPCHAATFSIGDATTIVSLAVFLLGMASLCLVWFSGRPSKEEVVREGCAAESGAGGPKLPFLPGALHVLKIVILDVLLQRRLFLQSGVRWFIHGLIFFPFVFRFLWGITALLASLWAPGASLPWAMLDKNAPLGGLLFDISGLMILLGVALAAIRRIAAENRAVSGLPKPDWPALCLIGGIVIAGFVLEGMRIAMTGTPPGSEYSFAGYLVSRLFAGSLRLPDVYGYVWYLHAILTGAFAAYLPFSQLLHIIMAPIAMTLNAVLHARDRMESVPGDRGPAKGIQH